MTTDTRTRSSMFTFAESLRVPQLVNLVPGDSSIGCGESVVP